MLLDARRLKNSKTFEADVCIVGCGPAGTTLARELMEVGLTVVILESGGRRAEASAQTLNHGEVVGDAYAGLRETRHRQVGGSPNIWNTPVQGGLGAKYVPLDPWDFRTRPYHPLSGWPLDSKELEPFYVRAQKVCGLGPFSYDGSRWATEERPAIDLHSSLTLGVYQFGRQGLFVRQHVEELRNCPTVHVLYHATVRELEVARGGDHVVAARAASAPGTDFRVLAPLFVLAGGGIENARLLLVSGRAGKAGRSEQTGLGNGAGWVGRCFMEHPRDFSMTLIPSSPRVFSKLRFLDPHEAPDGTIVGGRIGLAEEALTMGVLPNASITFLPDIRERSTIVDWAARFWLCPHSSGRRGFRGGYGWSRMKKPSRWLRGFRLVLNLEQSPNPENRVSLSQDRDLMGVFRPRLHWRWRPEEQEGLERLRDEVAGWIERSGLGRVYGQRDVPPDPNACHHAGTTRMSSSPEQGVVDREGRIHELENLYVAGGSVFPTVGYANPTLTIVALALRLAGHLAARLGAMSGSRP